MSKTKWKNKAEKRARNKARKEIADAFSTLMEAFLKHPAVERRLLGIFLAGASRVGEEYVELDVDASSLALDDWVQRKPDRRKSKLPYSLGD